ncbi:PA2169 family four-helix-bundle protein [Chryseobacterium sp. SIMBA_029]|uniref:PA2169 family four-helix-bundle protein n=1 Tax=Chryseobacterium sp. SIMBA_029 TaxID=3085772 RepID=UPI00397DB295
MKTEQTVSLLNDLLQITNDRIKGFGKVEGKVWEMYPDIKNEYDRMISQSKIMKNELINLITEKNGIPNDSTSVAGALHRTWIDIKNSFTVGNIEESTLENVVFGEKAAIEAYQKALDSGDLCEKSANIISEQLHSLKVSYHQFKKIEEYKKKE